MKHLNGLKGTRFLHSISAEPAQRQLDCRVWHHPGIPGREIGLAGIWVTCSNLLCQRIQKTWLLWMFLKFQNILVHYSRNAAFNIHSVFQLGIRTFPCMGPSFWFLQQHTKSQSQSSRPTFDPRWEAFSPESMGFFSEKEILERSQAIPDAKIEDVSRDGSVFGSAGSLPVWLGLCQTYGRYPAYPAYSATLKLPKAYSASWSTWFGTTTLKKHGMASSAERLPR